MKTSVRSQPRSRLRLAVFGVIALVIGALHVPMAGSVEARAATIGYTENFGGWEIGSFVSSTGQLVYCLEPGAVDPSGDQQGAYLAETLGWYASTTFDTTGWSGSVTSGYASGEVLRQMNWVLYTYGQTTDPSTAAAVQLAIWILRGDPGVADWLDHHLNWVVNHGGAAHVERAHLFAAQARERAVPAGTPEPDAPLVIVPGSLSGTGSVSYPAGTTKLRIDGGVFAGGATELVVDPSSAGTASWTAVAHADGWSGRAAIEISADWRGEVVDWPASLMVHSPVTQNQQQLGSMASPVVRTVDGDIEPVQATVDLSFRPIVGTRTEERFVPRGPGEFADLLTFSVAEGSGPWASRGHPDGGVEYVPVSADGVLYGPFSEPQEIASEAPDDAPVAARSTIIADRGPGEYRAIADAKPEESGYYYWVWSIREQNQHSEVRAGGLLPEGYEFRDQFGLVAESQIVPTALRWDTRLVDQELALDELRVRDRLDLRLHDGAWLRDESGEHIPAVLRLTVYRADEAPERQESVPDGAEEIARETLVVTDEGREIPAPDIALPFETRGWVTVRTCLLAEDQEEEYRGAFEEWCDDFGIPSETARVAVPTVRTEAQPEAQVGETFHDIAIVDGRVPTGAEVGFTYYLEPVPGEPRYDDEWNPVLDRDGEPVLWTEDDLTGLDADERCLAQPVATTERVDVPEAGRYRSPLIEARSVGVGYWVEDLTMPHPDSGDTVELHRGDCGLEAERTIIVEPEAAVDSAAEVAVVAAASKAPRLPETGAVPAPWLLLAAGVPLLGLALVVGGRLRGRDRNSS